MLHSLTQERQAIFDRYRLTDHEREWAEQLIEMLPHEYTAAPNYLLDLSGRGAVLAAVVEFRQLRAVVRAEALSSMARADAEVF